MDEELHYCDRPFCMQPCKRTRWRGEATPPSRTRTEHVTPPIVRSAKVASTRPGLISSATSPFPHERDGVRVGVLLLLVVSSPDRRALWRGGQRAVVIGAGGERGTNGQHTFGPDHNAPDGARPLPPPPPPPPPPPLLFLVIFFSSLTSLFGKARLLATATRVMEK